MLLDMILANCRRDVLLPRTSRGVISAGGSTVPDRSSYPENELVIFPAVEIEALWCIFKHRFLSALFQRGSCRGGRLLRNALSSTDCSDDAGRLIGIRGYVDSGST